MNLKDFIPNNPSNVFPGFNKEDIKRINQIENVKDKVVAVLKLIHDPEISVNIWDLGLIYNIEYPTSNSICINMTLTSPNCPVADAIPKEIGSKIKQHVEEIKEVDVKLVWEPRWSREMMSEEARFILDM